MTRVDFYISHSTRAQNELHTACRLADKAFRLGHSVYIHTANAEQAERLDDLLWTFRDGSFVPHGLQQGASGNDLPIVIGHDSEPTEIRDVLINLADAIPGFFSRFERVAEVVNGRAELRDAARERFRFYRERGYALESHDITD
ncbi:MAG: DNA polymerase III subunit chi [Granulosicoccaceae bacterium]|jgi:DNA polymerase-3 subunit chi